MLNNQNIGRVIKDQGKGGYLVVKEIFFYRRKAKKYLTTGKSNKNTQFRLYKMVPGIAEIQRQ